MRAILAICALLWLAAPAPAAEPYRVGALEIVQPWTRATPSGATVAGGYLRIRNTGSAPDRLVGGSSEVAKRFEIHSMAMDGGVMRMRQVADGLEIKPGETVEFKPGGLHVMFVDLTRPLKKGERIKGTLRFEKAGAVDVEFPVEAIGANPGGAGGHGAGH